MFRLHCIIEYTRGGRRTIIVAAYTLNFHDKFCIYSILSTENRKVRFSPQILFRRRFTVKNPCVEMIMYYLCNVMEII